MEADREQRQSTNLVIPTLYALAASGVLVVGWLGLQWLFNKFDAAFERRYKAHIKDGAIQRVRIFR